MDETRRPRTSGGLDIDSLLEALSQQRWTIVLFVGAVLIAALAGSLATEKQYRAVALIQLMPRAGQEVELNAVVNHDDGGYMERRDRARTQIQIILSRTVRQEALRRYAAMGYADIPADSEGAGILKEALSAGPREDTQLVEIRVTWNDPEHAAVLANLITDVYRENNLGLRTGAAQQTQVWLEGQTTEQRAALDAATQAVLDFKAENDLVDIDSKVDDITRRMSALQTALGDTTTQRVLLESALVEHERMLSEGQHDVLAGLIQDPALDAMARQRAELVTEAVDALAIYGDQHPEHQQARERIRGIESLLEAEVQRHVAGQRALSTTLRRQEGQLGRELSRVKDELLQKQRLQEEYADLVLEVDRTRRMYGLLGERESEVELQARTRLNDVRVVELAVPPGRPVKPNIPLNMAMALVVGIAGGLGLGLVRHRFSDTLLTAGDVTRHLDAPLLAVLPTLPDGLSAADRDLYAFTHPRTLAAESVRGLREMLHPLAAQRGCRLLITSSLKGEGKSSLALSLAATCARMSGSAILIDADLHRPRLHDALNMDRAPGLSDVVGGAADLERALRPTVVPGLALMACGSRTEQPDRMLASPEMERLLSELSRRYAVVIIDSPPVVPVTDALGLARSVDGVVLVARKGQPPRSMVAQTIKKLRRAGARVLGIALNDVRPSRETLRYSASYYTEERAPSRPPLAS